MDSCSALMAGRRDVSEVAAYLLVDQSGWCNGISCVDSYCRSMLVPTENRSRGRSLFRVALVRLPARLSMLVDRYPRHRSACVASSVAAMASRSAF